MIRFVNDSLTHPKTVIVGKHPLLRQFGRDIGYPIGGSILGSGTGSLLGRGIGWAIGGKKGSEAGRRLGAVAGGYVGAVRGFVGSTRRAEILRQRLRIGGAPIKPLRQFGMQVGTTLLGLTPFAASPAVRLAWRRKFGVRSPRKRIK